MLQVRGGTPKTAISGDKYDTFDSPDCMYYIVCNMHMYLVSHGWLRYTWLTVSCKIAGIKRLHCVESPTVSECLKVLFRMTSNLQYEDDIWKKNPSKNANVVDSFAKRLKAVWPKKIFNLTKLYSQKNYIFDSQQLWNGPNIFDCSLVEAVQGIALSSRNSVCVLPKFHRIVQDKFKHVELYQIIS